MEATDIILTPSSHQERNFMEEFLPYYKIREAGKTPIKHDLSNSNESLNRPIKGQKNEVDVSQIIIDGTNLSTGAGRSSPINELKVTSASPAHSKKKPKSKKNASSVEDNPSKSKTHKRSKSVSFMLDENDQEVAQNKVKKHKKSDGENQAEDNQMNEDKVTKKSKKKKNKSKFKTDAIPAQSILEGESNQGDNNIKHKKNKKGTRKEETQETFSEAETNRPEKAKKAKKQKHHNKLDNDSEPASKTHKTEVITDNLENIAIEDNTNNLTDLINEMTVVDKAKQKKKKKSSNKAKQQSQNNTSEKKPKQTKSDDIKQTVTDDKIQNETDNKIQNKTDDKNPRQAENGKNTDDTKNAEETTLKKKWVKKRWNKQEIRERESWILNVENLPVSLLQRNFKKIIIDHFLTHGILMNVGEPVIVDEACSYPVFTTRAYFNTKEDTAKALVNLDKTTLAGNEIRVSKVLPKKETVVVLRVYNPPANLGADDVRTALSDIGLIMSIRINNKTKKNMAAIFIEFFDPEAAKRALLKCANIQMQGGKVVAEAYTEYQRPIENNKPKLKRKRSRKGSKAGKQTLPQEDTKVAADDVNEESGDDD